MRGAAVSRWHTNVKMLACAGTSTASQISRTMNVKSVVARGQRFKNDAQTRSAFFRNCDRAATDGCTVKNCDSAILIVEAHLLYGYKKMKHLRG
jgi:hypothetical protein